MKTPRTLLNQLEEAGCRIAGIAGTRSGELLLDAEPKTNQLLAQHIRSLEWTIPEIAEAMAKLASRIERRFCPGPVKFDRDGYFVKSDGQLARTEQTRALAKAYYEGSETSAV